MPGVSNATDITGFTSSLNNTRSPASITSDFTPDVNAAQLVSPMNGGIVQPSTEIGRSLRGAVTLKTFSAWVNVPFIPVSCSIFAVSSAA